MINFETQEARKQSGLFLFKSLQLLWTNALDLVFPPRCQHCGQVDIGFCQTCHDELLAFQIELIPATVAPMSDVISSGMHTGLLQSAVQALKYSGQRHLGHVLAKRLAKTIESTEWRFDTVIPVPLHTARLQKRGYNQAREISIHLAQLLDKPHDDTLLIRQMQTQSQVGLNQEERIENVKEAFQISSNHLEGAIVLLVDDVRTTGATMASCAEALLASGVKEVYGITVTAAGRFQ